MTDHTAKPQKAPSKPASKESLEAKPPSRQRNSLLAERNAYERGPESSASETEDIVNTRRLSFRRRGVSKPYLRPTKAGEDSESDSDSPTFLPFAAGLGKESESRERQSPSSTLRGGHDQFSRPLSNRRATMERIPQSTRPYLEPQTSTATTATSTSSMSESFTSSGAPRSESPHSQTSPPNPSRGTSGLRPTGPLSPQRATELARVGLSPSPRRTHGATRRDDPTSDGTGTPSIGSSFSDLDGKSTNLHPIPLHYQLYWFQLLS